MMRWAWICLAWFALECRAEPGNEATQLDPVSASGQAVDAMQTADVTVIDRTQLQAAGQTTLVELLQAQPGIEISQYGGSGAPAGVYLRGANANDTLVLIDGLRADSATTGLTPLETLSPQQIQSIRIVRGAAAAQYGADAVGGVIVIETLSPDTTPQLDAQFGLGSYGLREAEADASGHSSTTRYSMGVSETTQQGFPDIQPGYPYYSPAANSDDKTAAHVNVQQPLDGDNLLTLTLLYNRDRNAYSAGGSDDHAINQVNSGELGWDSQWASWWHSNLQLATGATDNVNFGAAAGQFNTQHNQINWQNQLTLAGQHVSLQGSLDQQQVNSSTAYVIDSRLMQQWTLGWQPNVASQHIQVTLGDQQASGIGSHTNAAISDAWRLAPDWLLHANAGSAWRVPDFDELYFPYTNDGYGYAYVGNPLLQPEHSMQAEAGIQYQHQQTQWGLTGFVHRIDNLIEYDPSVSPATEINVDHARIAGMSLIAQQSLAGVRWHASLDWQHAIDLTNDTQLPLRAPLHGTLGADTGWQSWQLGAQMLSSGARYADAANSSQLGGYSLFDIYAQRALAAHWSLQLRFNNLFNKQYQLVQGYNTPGANVFVGVRWQEKAE